MTGNWYVIHSKPRQERKAEENLQTQGFKVYLPRLKRSIRRAGKWVKVIEPLFPRYLFIYLVMHEDDLSPIRSTRGVSRLLRFGDVPAKAPDSFIEALQSKENPEAGCLVQGDERFEQGSKVAIVEGPLKGLKGLIQSDSGEERVILLLNLLGRENATKVSRNDVVPVTD